MQISILVPVFYYSDTGVCVLVVVVVITLFLLLMVFNKADINLQLGVYTEQQLACAMMDIILLSLLNDDCEAMVA